MLSTLPSRIRTFPNPGLGSKGPNLPVACEGSTPAIGRTTGILFGITIFCLAGIVFAFWLRSVPAGHPDPRLAFNVFYYLFARNEPAGLLVVALFSAGAALWFRRSQSLVEDRPVENGILTGWVCIAVAVVVFAIAAIGTDLVFHDYALTADEYLADFQAQIFMRGKLQAQVPPHLWDAVRVIKPTFVEYFPATHSWNATYYPVYAAMRAFFQYVDLAALLNPFLAAVTLIALYQTARNLWPNETGAALAAVLLLATSSQFLLMSMTAYAMPTHLAFNTIWLCLYSRPDRRAFYLAPVVGVLAMGLHQPFPHALFAAPFLLRLVRERRWRAMSIFAAIYALGCFGWLIWRAHFQSPLPHGASSVFRLWNPRMAIIQPMNLLLIIAWASLATPLLAVLGLARLRKLPPFLKDCALSCALTFAFYYFFYMDQSHGWGYRYFHGALGCLVLIAVAGHRWLGDEIGRARAQRFLFAGAAASLLVVLPIRAMQAESFVRPYARAAAALHSLPTQTVALDARAAWYSADLIRNDPFLENRPIIVSIYGLNPQSIVALERLGSVRFIDREDLKRLGMFTERRDDYARDPFLLGRGK